MVGTTTLPEQPSVPTGRGTRVAVPRPMAVFMSPLVTTRTTVWPGRAQGWYYLASGVWPLVHYRSFIAVTGPKADDWLVRTFGALIAVVGVELVRRPRALPRGGVSRGARHRRAGLRAARTHQSRLPARRSGRRAVHRGVGVAD